MSQFGNNNGFNPIKELKNLRNSLVCLNVKAMLKELAEINQQLDSKTVKDDNLKLELMNKRYFIIEALELP